MSRPIDLRRVRAALAGAATTTLEKPRRAAVAVVLSATRDSPDGLSVLLVQRSERSDDPWSGHIALPGGHEHRDDLDLLHTARRETLEEVGLDLQGAELIGGLDDITPMRSSDIVVRPFVFWLGQPAPLQLSQEIAEVLWLPLDELARPASRTTHEVDIRATRLKVPAYLVGERVLWGMTLRLLDDFLARVAAPLEQL